MKMKIDFLLLLSLLCMFSSFSLSSEIPRESEEEYYLTADFYDTSCPTAQEIVKSVVTEAVKNEARMAASLLRLHFHDCFVQGCDGSILLDDNDEYNIVSEKASNPNKNSIRGFEVVDEIKSQLESACPHTVSCADILSIAARDSVVLSGGPSWEVPLGRRDSRTASLSDSNKNIPAPNSTLDTLVAMFKQQGLDETDLVALSGGHSIGQSRCVSFKQRLYNQNGSGEPDYGIDRRYFDELLSRCPSSGGDNDLSPLDVESPTDFDGSYYTNLLNGRGLLTSDQELADEETTTIDTVALYADDEDLFFEQFAKSMVKMGNINPLSGSQGEIRIQCRSPLDS